MFFEKDMLAAVQFIQRFLRTPINQGFSQVLTAEHLSDFADMAGIEFLRIDADTQIHHFKNELRWNEAYYWLAK